jgi:hypothetical protein
LKSLMQKWDEVYRQKVVERFINHKVAECLKCNGKGWYEVGKIENLWMIDNRIKKLCSCRAEAKREVLMALTPLRKDFQQLTNDEFLHLKRLGMLYELYPEYVETIDTRGKKIKAEEKAKGKYEKYEHHKKEVWVKKELKGTHRECCLCFDCENFHPFEITNCHIAQANFELCKKFNTVQPVFECPEFKEKFNAKTPTTQTTEKSD